MSLLSTFLEEGLAATELEVPLIDVWIAVRTDFAADAEPEIFGRGTRDNPYDGSTAVRFDLIMRTVVGERTIVHLGPGVFRTAGAGIFVAGWQAKSGQKIIGSGILSTTLLYTAEASIASNVKTAVVTHDATTPLQNWAISDLTIDCNLQNQPFAVDQDFPRLAIGAIAVLGDNLRVRRVRVINFGTRTPDLLNGESNPVASLENFPIRVGGRATKETPPNSPGGTAEEFTVLPKSLILWEKGEGIGGDGRSAAA
ncbi:MAG TPA: hypothetical protein VK633_10330 [Verrucomicrobiae bacterium]|nr:hypothetical protein [Verrucomicrobiae bacterium]